MANDVRNENYIFPSKHVPDCFSNESLLENIGMISSIVGNTDDIIKLSFKVKDSSITQYKGCEDMVYGLKKGVEPINITISKPNGGNRLISIANPLSLIPLDFYLMENANDILSEQIEPTEKYYSSSRYEYDENGITVGYTYDGEILTEDTEELVQKGFEDKEMITHNICSGRYYHMSIDVSDFFNSIYTHSISWNLLHNQNKCIFDNIDVLSRTLNRNETKGILIGPYTSGIFSEIILSKIDREIIEKYADEDVSFVHFCDDYDFFSDSKEKLELEVKNFVGNCFIKYGLNLNLSKYKVEEFPFVSLKNIQKERIYIFKSRIKNENFDSALDYVENIMSELSSALRVKYSNCNYMLSILNSLYAKDEIPKKYLDKDTSKILLDFLINLMFKNNLVSKSSANLIISIINRLSFNNIEKNLIINKWINKRNTCMVQLKEVTDLWLQYIILELDCNTKIITTYMSGLLKVGVLQSIMCFEYFDKHDLISDQYDLINDFLNNIKKELDSRFGNSWQKAAYDTKYWLLFYTNSVRWNFDSNPLFANTLFDELNIIRLVQDVSMPDRLKILEILCKNNVEFFRI